MRHENENDPPSMVVDRYGFRSGIRPLNFLFWVSFAAMWTPIEPIYISLMRHPSPAWVTTFRSVAPLFVAPA